MKARAAKKAPNMAAAFSKMHITMRKGVAKSSKRISFGRNVPNEFKLVGALVLMLAVLYVFQLMSSPSFLKSQVNSVTGLVVSDAPQQQQTTQPPQQTAAASTSTSATKKETNQQQQAAPQQTSQVSTSSTPQKPLIKIIEPAKGSTVSPGFTVRVEFNKDSFVCYYQVKDKDTTTWDRRMRPCKTEFTVEPNYCKTTGKNTCFVHVDASNQDGSVVSNDEAYYSIQ